MTQQLAKVSLVALALMASAYSPTPVHAAPSVAATTTSAASTRTAQPSTRTTPSVTPTSAAVVERAIDLQKRIDRNREELAALRVRTTVMNDRLFRQRRALSNARAALMEAESRYRDRVVRIYKTGTASPFRLLFEADSITEFYRHAIMLNRLAEDDLSALEKARLAATEAAYEATILEEMKSQLVEMAKIERARVADLEKALAERKRLERQLDRAGRSRLGDFAGSAKRSRQDWNRSSIPLNSRIGLKKATVDPYSEPFYVPTYQPDHYASTGRGFGAVCSWYGPGFNGRRSASGQIFNENDFTCASKTLPFGTRLALTRAGRRVVVVVNDRGPFIPGRDLDLSKAAAQALGFSGVATVRAEIVRVVR